MHNRQYGSDQNMLDVEMRKKTASNLKKRNVDGKT